MSLCDSCNFGLHRGTDPTVLYPLGKKEHICLLASDQPVQPVTLCNGYRKSKKKTITYHDPDFHRYEKEST